MLVDHYDERIGENVLGLGVVPTFSETPGSVRNAGASAPGHDNSSVWGGLLGLSDDEQAELKTKGVI